MRFLMLLILVLGVNCSSTHTLILEKSTKLDSCLKVIRVKEIPSNPSFQEVIYKDKCRK